MSGRVKLRPMARCRFCQRWIALKKDGSLFRHGDPFYSETDDHRAQVCDGVGQWPDGASTPDGA